jgi:hypothetical protein
MNFYEYNVDWPIVLDACYFNINTVSFHQWHHNFALNIALIAVHQHSHIYTNTNNYFL